jgi:hypothetical protein
MTVSCTKIVSGQPVLRAGHKEPDGAAAELAIHVEAANEEPLNTNFSSYTAPG